MIGSINSFPSDKNKNDSEFEIKIGQLSFNPQNLKRLYQDKNSLLYYEGVITQFLCQEVKWDPSQPLRSFNQLFKKHGENYVSQLDGLFICIFKPEQSESTFIINNRYEANRLYYYQENQSFYFSSSLQSLISTFNIQPKAYYGSIKSFLSNGFTISEKTQLNGVSKLLPADFLIIQGSDITRKTYWPGEITFHRHSFSDLNTQLDHYENLYKSELAQYIKASQSKSIGTLLSGGHDTSFVAAQASQVLKSLNLANLKTFTVTFPGWDFSEEKYAQNISNKFQCEYHEVPFTSDDLDSIIDLIVSCEEPVVGSSLPLHKLMKYASTKVDLMLGGDGGDTLWGEYYPVAEYHRLTHWLPLRFRKLLANLSTFLRKITDWERFWELEHVAHLFADSNYHDDFLRKLCTYRHFNNQDLNRLLRDEIKSVPYSRSHNEISYRKSQFHNALIESKLYNGFYTYQSFHTGKSARRFNMDLYLPTINKKIIDFITNLPYCWVNGGHSLQRLSNNKKINRKFHKLALSRHLNKNEIYNRSFDIPWFQIIKPRTDLLTLLLKNLIKRDWYNQNELEFLFNQFQNQKIKKTELLELKNHGYRIFTLLSLEIWSLIFIDKIKTQDNMKLEELLMLGLKIDKSSD